VRLRALVALLVVALAGLLPLAYASPPDPSWIEGFWDGADHDDVVLLAMASAEAVAPAVVVVAVARELTGFVWAALSMPAEPAASEGRQPGPPLPTGEAPPRSTRGLRRGATL